MKFHMLTTVAIAMLCYTGMAIAEDRIAERIDTAEERYEKSIEALSDKLVRLIDIEIERAKRTGNLNLLRELEEEKRLYVQELVFPVHESLSDATRIHEQGRVREVDKLIKIYEYAVTEYTKAGDVEAAERVVQRIERVNPEPKLVIDEAQRSVIPHQGHKEFTNGLLREVRGSKHGKWIDLSVVDDTTQQSWVPNNWQLGHIQYKNGKLREAYQDVRGEWIDLALITNKMQESKIKGHAHIQYQNGKLREVHGDKTGEWIVIYRVEQNSLTPQQDRIAKLKNATVEHNQLILAEREKLQSTILKADKEETIVIAKTNYKSRITTIKNAYVDDLQRVLNQAIEDERIEFGGYIKTQILRVKAQIDRLSEKNDPNGIPAIDGGKAEQAAIDDEPALPEKEQASDETNTTESGGDDSETFFGIPLE